MATSIQFQTLGQNGDFKRVSVPKPTPGAEDVTLRMRVAAVNPVEVKQYYDALMNPSWPKVQGGEGAGVIEAIGNDVTRFAPGDKVYGYFGSFMSTPDRAAFQEVAVAQVDRLGKAPQSLSLEEAAALPVGYITAMAAVHSVLKIPVPFLPESTNTGFQPSSVLVLGGSSSIGGASIQILRLALPSATILTTSSAKHHNHLVSLGATKAFDQNSSSLIANIKAASPGGLGVDAIIDSVSSGARQTSISDVLREDGPKEYADVQTGTQVSVPSGVKKIPVISTVVFEGPQGKHLLSTLTRLVDEGKYKVPVKVEVVGKDFEAIPKAYEKIRAGVSGQKLVVSL